MNDVNLDTLQKQPIQLTPKATYIDKTTYIQLKN